MVDQLGIEEVRRRVLKVRRSLPASATWPGGVPAIVQKVGDAPAGAASVHRMPEHTRTVCLEFFGNAKDAVPSIVEIKDFMFAEAARAPTGSLRPCCSPASSTWTTGI